MQVKKSEGQLESLTLSEELDSPDKRSSALAGHHPSPSFIHCMRSCLDCKLHLILTIAHERVSGKITVGSARTVNFKKSNHAARHPLLAATKLALTYVLHVQASCRSSGRTAR